MHLSRNHFDTLFILAGVIAGALCGSLWPDLALKLKTVGDIFLNLLFVLVVPLVFFSISAAFYRMTSRKELGCTLLKTLAAFAVIWVAGAALSYVFTRLVDISPSAGMTISAAGESAASSGASLADALTVSDFPLLFSKFHILPLIIFSMLIGAGAALAGESCRRFQNFMDAGNAIVIKSMDILMKAAPVGLGCYFAGIIASMGGGVLGGYFKVFWGYCAVSALLVIVVYPALVLARQGRRGLGAYARHILQPSITALATASSSVAIPGNIAAAERMGLDSNVARSVVPLATNLLKGGSVALDVLKVVFLASLTQTAIGGFFAPLTVIGISIMSALVSGAVANGGVTGEILICTLLGVKPEMAGVVMIIGTICDIPATLVNSQSTVVAAALVSPKRSCRVIGRRPC